MRIMCVAGLLIPVVAILPAADVAGGTLSQLTNELVPSPDQVPGAGPLLSLAVAAVRGLTRAAVVLGDRRIAWFLALVLIMLAAADMSPRCWARVRRSLSLRTERGRYVILATAGAIIFLVVAVFRPGSQVSPVFVGRLLFLVLLVLGVIWVLTARGAGTDYQGVLAAVGRQHSLHLIASAADERCHPDLHHTRRFLDPDTRRWELDGSLPYLYGERASGILTVRVPVGFDYDVGSPTSTRVGCFKRTGMSGFTVRDRAGCKGVKRTIDTGDEEFDALFVVEGRDQAEVARVLDADRRRSLLALGSMGYGLRVDMFGVKVYLRDRVVDPALLGRWLAEIEGIAASLPGS